MTKELEKETEEYDLVIRFKSNKPKYEIRGYIINHILDEFDNLQMWDFKRSGEIIEPREKRIEELEKENKKLILGNKSLSEKLVNITRKKLDLQKENAELKKTVEHYRKEREFFIGEVEK